MKHAFETTLLDSENDLAVMYGTVIHLRLFREYDKLLKAGAPEPEINQAKDKVNKQALLMAELFKGWTPFKEYGRDEEERIINEGAIHFQKKQQIVMANKAYVDFSQYTLGISRLHPNFNSRQWAPPYGFNTTKNDAVEHVCRIELKDMLRDDEYLRLNLERGVNTSQIHGCRPGYCVKTKRVRVSQKEKALEAAEAKDKFVDTLPPIPIEDEPEEDAAPTNDKDKGAKKNEKFDKLGRKKPKYELQRICRFGFAKDYDGFDADYKTDEAGKIYLNKVERKYHPETGKPEMEEGGRVDFKDGKVATPRNHARVNRKVLTCFFQKAPIRKK